MALDSIASLALWVAFACMFSSFIYFYCLFRKATPGKRIFHVMTTAIVGFAATSYFFMALGQGSIDVDGRAFYYARYLDWLVTTPLLLLDLGGLCKLGMEDSLMLVALDILMVLAGLAGGINSGPGCLWMYLLGCAFFVPIVYDLLFTFRYKAAEVGTAPVYTKLMGITVVLWTLYPLVFFFAEYKNTLSETNEILCYAVLDVIAKCVFGLILLNSRESIEKVTDGGYETVV
eukprot:scaffold409_cov295-Chaetoceros_neogracile.AAC.16